MKLVFLSNFFNHHQQPLCEALTEETDSGFVFVETAAITEERKKMGWGSAAIPEYVKKTYVSEAHFNEVQSLVNASDVVIQGTADDTLIREHLRRKKTVFRYAERIYKSGYQAWKWPMRLIRFWMRYGRYKSMYMLCASGYTAADYAKYGTFLHKTYRWGYFPETKRYENIPLLFSQKNVNEILWVARFLHWKHPEVPIQIAKKLKSAGYRFNMKIIGSGDMEASLRTMIQEESLSDEVHLLGTMSPEQVRSEMENAGIFLFTSDFNEGWGAVLNEAMNSGCAVVASHAIGSVPFLLKHRENGLIYENGNFEDVYQKVRYFLDNPDEQRRMGENAYRTIADLWNAEIAAERFVKLANEIRIHGSCDLYEDGPCSRAKIIKNDWFRGCV